MAEDGEPTRPDFSKEMRLEEFAKWYWSKSDLEEICDRLGISKAGNKADLRARVEFRLRYPDRPVPKLKRQSKDGFPWGRAELSKETMITASITFGPNVRRFFAAQVGSNFVCHSDFMDWVRSNVGANLGEAIEAWWALERRKDDPAFRREIAGHNNFLQYLRDFQNAYPDHSLDDGKRCWDAKKIRPAKDGMVVFEWDDTRFIEPRD